MDKLTLITGIVGIVLLVISIAIIVSAIVKLVKRKISFKNFIAPFLRFLIIFLISTSLILLTLFLMSFKNFTYEEKIGTVVANKINSETNITFLDEHAKREYSFTLNGDQWVIEGYILRWNNALRFLGVHSYYTVTRFEGRFEKPSETPIKSYEIYPEGEVWQFFLKNADKIPFVDAAYGIAAFAYPDNTTTYTVYINDTGFIIRK
ncbi:MAG: hypothetical protein KBG49_14170 [Spirochaetes bacterium]|nr:hypothetical protein [Spirochaetota bacterium]